MQVQEEALAAVDDESQNATWLRSALDAVTGRTPGLANTQPVGCTIKWTL